MSSSGLIYAVIVGAWAAYLVPMWLRRQDELNESRPTERFSTAIRLLAGRSALERRASRALGDDEPADHSADGRTDGPAGGESGDAPTRVAARPADGPSAAAAPVPVPSVPSASASAAATPSALAVAQANDKRARLLARRRRMVTLLFGAFALGAVAAAVAGVAFLWVPALPAALLTLYIGHLRRLERQRFEVKLDRARAAAAAQRVREREQARSVETVRVAAAPSGVAPEPAAVAEPPAAEPAPEPEQRQALVEATDHAEWVDGLRERAAAGPDSWEPVPVPLPTYVTAPVAPRINRGLDLNTPGTWNSGRTTEAPRTPLFDQYQDPAPQQRPRAANE
ncbi:hypothetical protein [Kitasatospora viridis]|uniref:Uncharacterized protein n=1 Tax=Kitasatospora viridis TaxID=281105 RepID=A0A561UG12_9ACTN|nr:hypothetical protein [Kitasatospora viridis]TWF98286.1 hypothetical protein FHX73_112093 [Kitasatospora viridis]